MSKELREGGLVCIHVEIMLIYSSAVFLEWVSVHFVCICVSARVKKAHESVCVCVCVLSERARCGGVGVLQTQGSRCAVNSKWTCD